MKLSRSDIEMLAVKIVKKYREIKTGDDPRINLVFMAEQLLGLKIKYAHLSPDGKTYGLTSSESIDIEVLDKCYQPVVVELDGKTILIEQKLIDEQKNKGKYNFTLAHECAHQIIAMVYGNNESEKVHFYREPRPEITDFEEWQANTLAAAILLPYDALIRVMQLKKFDREERIIDWKHNAKQYMAFSQMAKYFGVSKQVLAIRLKQYGLIDSYNIHKPISREAVIVNCEGAYI